MYDIRSLNIWKNRKSSIFMSREKVLIADGLRREEIMMAGKFRFPMYVNENLMATELEVLDLSQRSINCLHRAGFQTIGQLVEGIDGSEDLKKIRNCGIKSVNEVMEKLLCYQYEKLDEAGKVKFLKRIAELNGRGI